MSIRSYVSVLGCKHTNTINKWRWPLSSFVAARYAVRHDVDVISVSKLVMASCDAREGDDAAKVDGCHTRQPALCSTSDSSRCPYLHTATPPVSAPPPRTCAPLPRTCAPHLSQAAASAFFTVLRLWLMFSWALFAAGATSADNVGMVAADEPLKDHTMQKRLDLRVHVKDM